MSTRNLPGCKGWPARGADNLTAICELIVQKMREPRRLTTLWASTACYRKSFALALPHFALSYDIPLITDTMDASKLYLTSNDTIT
jgi:hypothetical protein